MLEMQKVNQICGWVWDKTEIQFEQTKNNDDNQHSATMPHASMPEEIWEKNLFTQITHSMVG